MVNKVIAITLLFSAVSSLHAAEKPVEKSCVSVVVNGINTPSWECLSRQLQSPEQRDRISKNKQLAPLSERQASRPSNAIGLFNYSATSVRMGNHFGTSAAPQRPTAPPVHSPLLPAR
ncbi:MAG TPA: hypothetical protein VJS14_15080 [Enterobacteriaceae bacterium]|nr:hypothetical protein [Enterobacteriaceae bacterium]